MLQSFGWTGYFVLRTLGGLADWLDWGAPKTSQLAIDGTAGLRGAVITVTIHYASADPLG